MKFFCLAVLLSSSASKQPELPEKQYKPWEKVWEQPSTSE